MSRALRLISDGALDQASVEDLADRLGVSGRHLRRLFYEELGASPLAVAQTRRVHFAKKLLDETEIPISEVAFSAGFGSVRRFNDVARKWFGRTPADLRRTLRKTDSRTQALTLRLPFRPPFDWTSLIAFLKPRAIPGVEVVTDDSYRRTFAIDGSQGILEVRPSADEPCLHLMLASSETRALSRIVERVRRLFDCGADPLQISRHLSRDNGLAPLVDARPGLRVPGAIDGFELAVRAILGQQVTVAGASTLAGRLVREFGTPLPGADDGLTHLFPTPEILARAEPSRIGVPQARAMAIAGLAKAVIEDRSLVESSAGLDDAVASLRGVSGIGEWTAQYIAMRALGEPDAFPSGDLGLRRAASSGSESLSQRDLELRAEAWRPWRAYAAMHLWMKLK